VENNTQPKHKVIMTDRAFLSIEGVSNVGSFDEKEIILETEMGVMILKGENLHITQLNLESGSLCVEGAVNSIDYTEDRGVKTLKHRGKGMLDRIFK